MCVGVVSALVSVLVLSLPTLGEDEVSDAMLLINAPASPAAETEVCAPFVVWLSFADTCSSGSVCVSLCFPTSVSEEDAAPEVMVGSSQV